MKRICIVIALTISLSTAAQDRYQYYFIEIRTTGKAEIELAPENQVLYSDIDSLIVSSREKNKRGIEEVKGRKYDSYSAAFNRLSAAGLEFVQFTNLSSVGGATAALVGDIRVNYVIWRRKMN